jgi:hypothetical protein
MGNKDLERRRWDNIKRDIKEAGSGDGTQDRLQLGALL